MQPPLGDDERVALERALARVELDVDPSPYRSAWRLAAAHEAVDGDLDENGYALSPRSTRGATRA